MNIVFKELEINNFLSIGNIKLSFRENGLFLINGIKEDSNASDSNGAGKSTILESIMWCLFDKTIRGIKKDDVVNNTNKKNCFVKIKGILNDLPFEIIRYRKHKEGKNSVRFEYNEEDITQRSDTETNKKIQEIFKMSFDDFQTNIIFSNNSLKFLELGDTERKQLFDKIINSEIYEKCIINIKQKTKNIDIKINEIKLELSKINGQLETTKENLDKTKKDKEDWQNLKDKKVVKLQEELKELESLKQADKILIDGKEVDNIEKFEEDIKSKYEKLKKEQDLLLNDENIKIAEEILKAKRDGLEEARTEREKKVKDIENLKNKKSDYLKEITRLTDEGIKITESLKENKCPTCKQTLKSRKEIDKILDENNNKIKDLEKKSKEINIDPLFEDLKQFVEFGKKLKLEVDKKEEEVSRLKTEKHLEIKKINDQIEKFNNINYKIIEWKSEKSQKEQEIKLKNDELQNKISEINPYHTEYIENKISELEENKKDLEIKILNENNSIENYKYWINGFKKVKGLLISTITPIMNEKAIEYSEIISNGEFEVSFITQRENKDGTLKDVFEIDVKRKNGGQNYMSLSSGEKRRVDLITIFVLDELKRLNNIHNINIRFYDEIFDSLDSIGIEKLIFVLNKISENKQVFTISHKNNMKDLFANIITIINRDGISTLL